MHRRRILVPSVWLAILGLASAGAQTPTKTGYTVAGVVRNQNDSAVGDAQISLSRPGEPARLFRTADDGKYSFESVAPGWVLLSVRRLGYRGSAARLEVGPTMPSEPFDFHLAEIPADDPDFIVEDSKGHLREFYQHKAKNNFGKFFEEKDIVRLARTYISEVFRTVPGATLQATERNGNKVLLRGCQPIIWVDGIRAVGADIDELARPSDVAGMEVYPSWAGLPIEYQDRDNRMCGVVVLWTRGQ